MMGEEVAGWGLLVAGEEANSAASNQQPQTGNLLN